MRTADKFRNAPGIIGLRIETDRRIGVVHITREEFDLLREQAHEIGWAIWGAKK